MPRERDHRQDYPVMKLLVNGQRMVDGYNRDDAVRDYLALHPEADEATVREELRAKLVDMAGDRTHAED